MDIPSINIPVKPTPFAVNKKQAVIGGICVLFIASLSFFLMYQSAKRRAEELEQENEDLHDNIKERDVLIEEAQGLTRQANENFESIKQKYFALQQQEHQTTLQNDHLKQDLYALDTKYRQAKKKSKQTTKTKKVNIKKDSSLEKTAWLEAKEEDTLEAYELFLTKEFPTKRYRSVATRKVNTLKALQA